MFAFKRECSFINVDFFLFSRGHDSGNDGSNPDDFPESTDAIGTWAIINGVLELSLSNSS